MSIAGHLDARSIDTECCEYFCEFLGGQRCLEALTKQLLGSRTFVACMLRDERLDLFLARWAKQIPDKEETSWSEHTECFCEESLALGEMVH